MCRLVGWTSDRPVSLADVLGERALDRLVRLSSFHADGWGIAWRADDALHVRRSTRAAREDAGFTAMALEVRATTAIVHLRWATPGFGLGLVNTHPFVVGDEAMAHNGAMGPREGLGALLTDDAPHRPGGTTDSEHFFHGVLGELPASGGDLVTAVERTSARGADAGLRAASLNAMFLRPDGLHVLNWHDPANVPEAAVRSNADDPANPPYFDLRHRAGPGLDVVVSSGFVPDASSWDLLSPASITHFAAPGPAVVRPLRPERALCTVARPGALSPAALGPGI
ncbi:MAG TPA: class II glutamine amidotransferase [Jatrophihabitantaceae bacterium]|jgi:predicted glutamine amidotransferase|nr:class II glutamine amidotransferase [Jatrophihabitantaceae bacterium]